MNGKTGKILLSYFGTITEDYMLIRDLSKS